MDTCTWLLSCSVAVVASHFYAHIVYFDGITAENRKLGTENCDLNEDFVSAELQYQIHERYLIN